MAQYNTGNNSFQSANKTLFEVSMPNNTRLHSASFEMQVAMGKVPGVTGLSIAGYNSAVGTSFIPAWENGEYVYFNTAQTALVS